jgi:hypothetical protein
MLSGPDGEAAAALAVVGNYCWLKIDVSWEGYIIMGRIYLSQ